MKIQKRYKTHYINIFNNNELNSGDNSKRNIKSNIKKILKNSERGHFHFIDSIYKNKANKNKNKNMKKIKYSFNLFEIIITQIFKCCM